MNHKILLYLSVLFLSLLYSVKSFYIDSSKQFMLDENGRYKIFHGVNVVVKLPPYIPDTEKFDPYTSFTDEDIAILKKLGINLVRLGIIWESIEREEKVYDLEHLEKMYKIVDKLEQNNIAVIIDAHQDMFSRLFCGEGAPKFYVDKMTYQTTCSANLLSKFFGLVSACIPLSKNNWQYGEDGLPLVEDCVAGSFIDYHKSPELMSIYDSFFDNESGTLDAFIEFWKILADKFKNKKNVLGYDLWNEPWTPNLWTDLKSLMPGYIDDHKLKDFYIKLNDEIKEVDPNFTMLFEPTPFPDILPLFGGQTLSTFSSAPVDPELRQQMFNVHNYCCAADQNICKDGEPKMEDATTKCPDFHDRKVNKNKQQAQKMGVPLIITEFGACSSSLSCYYELLGFVKAADKYLTSWCYWMYKAFNDHTTTAAENEEGMFNPDGSLQSIKEKALSRTYIQSYQGIPLEVNFDDDTKVFTSSFTYIPEIREPSVLYLYKELNYPDGYTLEFTGDDGTPIEGVEVEEEGNYISFKLDQSTELKVTVTVTPK